MFLVPEGSRMLTGDGGARAGKYQTEAAVAGSAAVAVAVLPRTAYGDRENRMRAGRGLSAPRRSGGPPVAEVVYLSSQ